MDQFFSKEITLGNLITIAAMVFAFYKFHISNVQRIIEIETKVTIMWDQLRKRLNINGDGDQ